jgi:hypothetical protein
MSLDDFVTSESDETADCRTEKLSDPESLDLPEYVSVWVSNDGLMAMMEVPPSYFREHVSEETKDRAKEKGLIHLDDTREEPVIVLTDDPEDYGVLLDVFGLEDYLTKRIAGTI